MEYLHDTLENTLKFILKDRDSCEIDPNKIGKNENWEVNANRLGGHIENCWFAIRESVDYCPWELNEVYAAVKEYTISKFPADEIARYTAIRYGTLHV